MDLKSANINKIIDLISRGVTAANRADAEIGISFQGNFLCLVSIKLGLNKAINLEEDEAPQQLSTLLKELHAIIPIEQAYFDCERSGSNAQASRVISIFSNESKLINSSTNAALMLR